MSPSDRAALTMYAELPVFKRRYERAQDCIQQALALCSNPCVSFSAGKDSSAMLWMIATQKPDVSARILTSGESRLLHPNLDEIFAWWQERFPAMDFQEVLIDRVFTEEWKHASFDEQRHAGKGDIRRALPQTGDFDLWFIGLRSAESGWRKFWNRRHIEGTTHPIYQYKSGPAYRKGTYRCCPVAGWTEEDVGAVVALHDIPLPPSYETEGLDHRTTMRLTNAAVSMGTVAEVRDRDPQSYAILVARFPELGRLT